VSRPSLLPLPDDQAAILIRELPAVLAAHPAGESSHRPFIGDFIRIVHLATGRTFNPAIYRALLSVYVPGRMPSNDTIAKEKKAFDAARSEEVKSVSQLDAGSTDNLTALVQRAVEQSLAKMPRPAAVANDYQTRERIDYLQEQLVLSGQIANEARAQAARLAADLQEARAVREALQMQIDAANASIQQLGSANAALTQELTNVRTFAMTAVDSVRGETRVWQHRTQVLEVKLKEAKTHMEVFRQAAYARGAAIPPGLLESKT